MTHHFDIASIKSHSEEKKFDSAFLCLNITQCIAPTRTWQAKHMATQAHTSTHLHALTRTHTHSHARTCTHSHALAPWERERKRDMIAKKYGLSKWDSNVAISFKKISLVRLVHFSKIIYLHLTSDLATFIKLVSCCCCGMNLAVAAMITLKEVHLEC